MITKTCAGAPLEPLLVHDLAVSCNGVALLATTDHPGMDHSGPRLLDVSAKRRIIDEDEYDDDLDDDYLDDEDAEYADDEDDEDWDDEDEDDEDWDDDEFDDDEEDEDWDDDEDDE